MKINSEKLILNQEDLVSFSKKCKQESKKVVLATGVFDILHEGHMSFLEKIQEFGDIVIVGINNDIYGKIKGIDRPIQNERTRAFLVAGFHCVDCVHIFDDRNPNKSLLKLVQPDILIMSTSSTDKPKSRSHHFD